MFALLLNLIELVLTGYSTPRPCEVEQDVQELQLRVARLEAGLVIGCVLLLLFVIAIGRLNRERPVLPPRSPTASVSTQTYAYFQRRIELVDSADL